MHIWKCTDLNEFDVVADIKLAYIEDSRAQTDANFVLSGSGGIIEVQATAEDKPLAFDDFDALMVLAKKGCAEIFEAQKAAVKG